ncbi:hypothetical protein NQ314_005306 [Rhamnusium bicolor]|uniref:C-type lectin domain-containing protein n=1 Tax=Rhamnusium bicolor TaxID=1586634 RepID=A0AAV8ZK65_9CUCU|nr:hypothetical protein NQ314_005306 [Rhamnusium bicolor]
MGKGESVEYTNWATNQPDNENERCLEVLRDKDKGLLWNDRDCNGMLNFICEKEDQDTDSPENDSVSSWANVFDNSYVSPNVPLLHFGAKSYFVGRYFKATFLEAIGICKMMNMHLVTITSEEENTRLYKYIRDTNAGDGFWSSGSKLIDGKMWIWMSTSQIIEYTNWAPKQPDNNNEQCIHLILRKDNGLLWNDLGCNDRLHYICEKPRDFDSLDVNAKDVFGAGYGDSIIPCKGKFIIEK